MVCAGARSTVQITATDAGFRSAVVKKATDKKAVNAQVEALKAPQPASFNLELNRSRYSEGKARLSILRSAYLVAFAVTGYRLIGRWQRIRHQILNPNELDDALIRLVLYERESSRDERMFACITEPKDRQAYY